jgi:xanthine dehydrogenase accessory factor
MSTRAKMLVLPDGSIRGTIGGGKLEADVIKAAQQVLATQAPTIVAFDLTSDQVEAEGLTCGGSVEILIEWFSSDTSPEVLAVLAAIDSDDQVAVMITRLPDEGWVSSETLYAGQKLLVRPDESYVGTFGQADIDQTLVQLAGSRMGRDCLEIHTIGTPDSSSTETRSLRIFLETIVPHPTAYIFGGGHIAHQLARLLPTVDFKFVIIDDRERFANAQRFPDAKTCLVHDFADVFQKLSYDPRFAYIIIVTRGHQSDFQVLAQAITTRPKYIGMIGSTRKIQILFDQLRQQGVSQEMLHTIHAPIGLEIGADTPEEIAVSIAAELIKVRRET